MDGKKGNYVVVGETGCGKTTLASDVIKKRLSSKQRKDWLQLRRSLQHNKASGEQHHDNQ